MAVQVGGQVPRYQVRTGIAQYHTTIYLFICLIRMVSLMQVCGLSQSRFAVPHSKRSKHCCQGAVIQMLQPAHTLANSSVTGVKLLPIMQVTRDRLLRDTRAPELAGKGGTEYGSGYPGGQLSLHADKCNTVHSRDMCPVSPSMGTPEWTPALPHIDPFALLHMQHP